MKKRLLTMLTVSAFLPTMAFADESSQLALQTQLESMANYQASFTQVVTDVEGDLVNEAEGQLWLARPNKMRWETAFPEESLLIADGNAVWNIDNFVEQVTVFEQNASIANNPFILLTTSDKDTWSSFAIAQTINEGGNNTFVITPLEEGGQIQSLTLHIRDNTLVSLEMFDAQEQKSALAFSDIDTSTIPKSELFTPNIPEGFIVDDQRQ